MKTVNIVFYGIGGQGVLTASELCANAALASGLHVKKSEVHGMAQRGGSVESHLRFGKEVLSPLVPEGTADFLVCFSKSEHARLKHFLASGGRDLMGALDAAEAELGADSRFVNTFLAGALSAGIPEIAEECWIEAIKTTFGGKKTQENIDIFLKGRSKGGML